MRLVVDTSVFVAAFRREESSSDAALTLLEQIERGRVHAIVPFTVYVETTAALRRRTRNDAAAEKVFQTLLSLHALTCIDYLTRKDQLLVLSLAARSGLRGMDTFVLATAARYNLPLVTLDQELVRRARPFVEILSLKEVLR